MSSRYGATQWRARGWPLPLLAALLFLGCARRSPPPGLAGDLRVALGYDVASLDPHLNSTHGTLSQLSNVYEPLVGLDRDLRLVPVLAESWSNPNATTWSFRLRPGVRFHDGSLLTAEDVIFSVMRLKADETLAMRSQLSEVAGATVENGEIVLRTGRPSARLLIDLSLALIVRAGSTRESLEARPNGTGPYAVESWTPNRRLELRRHEGYWGAKPAHPRVEVEMGVTDDQAAAGIRDGRFSVIAGLPSAERAASQSPRYRLVRHPSLFLQHLAFNLSSSTVPGSEGAPNPFLRLQVRQAIDLALDRDRIAAAKSAYAIPARHIVPRAVFGYDSEVPTSIRDVAKARRLLGAAGYRNGFDVTLQNATGSPNPEADEVKAQLAQIGIRVSVGANRSSSDFLAAVRRRELSLWIIGDGSMTGEAGAILATQFHSPDPTRSLGLDNFSGYANRDLDRAIEESDATLDPMKRLPALQKALRLVEDNLLWIPLFRNTVLFIVDRALVFEPREDLLLHYGEIGRALTP